jgi:ATP-binding cassette, subfamily B, bacterial
MIGKVRARIRWLLAPAAEGDGLVAAAPRLGVIAIVRRCWPFVRPYRRWAALLFVFILLGPALDAVGIWMFKILVDQVLVPQDFGPFVWIALAFLGLTLLSGVVSFMDDYLSAFVAERFLLDLRTTFFRRLQGLSLDFFERRRLGDVIARQTADVDSVETLVLSGIADVVAYLVSIVMFGVALFILRWDLALASLFVIPVLWSAAGYFARRIRQATREERRRSGSIGAVTEESLSNTMLVQAYNRQDQELERFRREAVGVYEAELAASRLKALFRPVLGLTEFVGGMLVIGLGTWEMSQGRLTLGGLFAFFAYLARLYSPIQGLSQLQGTFFAASASAERIIEFLDSEPSVRDRPGARRIGRATGEVTFDDVSFRYPGTSIDALQNVSFSVGPGETLALVGPSGAGKSTIVKLLLRFYDPHAGRILLDGQDIADTKLWLVRANIGVVLQETLVFDGTVRQNIAYGRLRATDEQIIAAAKAADAHDFVSALPDGYETVIGQKGRRMSGGQRQRIAIARAMIRDAPVLILDEPTTGLDAESGERILEPLRRLMSGRSTIVISHNLQTVRDATKILVLEGGRVVEHGTHAELVEANGAYSRLHLPRSNGHGSVVALPAPRRSALG